MSLFGQLLSFLLFVYQLMIIVSVVLSWLSIELPDVLRRIFDATVEPLLRLIRTNLPHSYGNFDFSPLIALVAVWIVQRMIVPFLL